MIGVKEQVRWRSSFIWPSRKPKKATVESFSISRQNVEAHKHAIASKQSSDPKLYKTETRIKTNKKKKKNKVRTPLASSFYVVLLVLCYSIFCCFFFLSNVMSILKITHSLFYLYNNGFFSVFRSRLSPSRFFSHLPLRGCTIVFLFFFFLVSRFSYCIYLFLF